MAERLDSATKGRLDAYKEQTELLRLAQEQQEEQYLLFPEEFKELENAFSSCSLVPLLEKMKHRLMNLDEFLPEPPKVHPDTMNESLRTIDRALDSITALGIQIRKINTTLHESRKIRVQRMSRRSKRETANAPDQHSGGT